MDTSKASVRVPVLQPSGAHRASLRLFDRLQYDLDHDPKISKEVVLGKRVGLYRVRGQLGSGNFAKVKLGLHLLTHERVAIKIIDKSKLDDKAQKLLSREITCMEILDHPNIIRLFEVIETLSTLHLIMEVAGEGDLQSRIAKEGAMTEKQAKPIFAQITAAIRHMHQKGVFHRDFKAENVFFSSSNHIKVGDFGFSINTKANSLLDTFCGSPPYAAPELFSEDTYYGFLVDVWAMGVTLYFMLSAAMPFKGDTIAKLRTAIQEGNYIQLRKTTESCQQLVAGLLTVDPSSRWIVSDVCMCDWMQSERNTGNHISMNHFDLVSSALNVRNRKSCRYEEFVDSDVLSELKQLGAPITDHGAFCGEPRNSLAGAYRILLHRKSEAVKNQQNCKTSADQETLITTLIPRHSSDSNQKSRLCIIM